MASPGVIGVTNDADGVHWMRAAAEACKAAPGDAASVGGKREAATPDWWGKPSGGPMTDAFRSWRDEMNALVAADGPDDAPPQNNEPATADGEIGTCICCGAPGYRLLITGEPICNECDNMFITGDELVDDEEPARTADGKAGPDDAPKTPFLRWLAEIREQEEASRARMAELQSTRQGDKDDDEDLF